MNGKSILLKQQIEALRKKLNNMLIRKEVDSSNLDLNNQILSTSQELDVLINKYINSIDKINNKV